LCVIALLQITFVGTGFATTLRKLSLNDLVNASDEVIVGTCEKTETIWLENRIFTVATVKIGESAKGKAVAGDKVQIHILGGSVKEPLPVTMRVEGAETLAVGEEAVLFLERFGNNKEYRRVVGMAQGKVPVTTDAKTGAKQARYGLPIKGVKWVDNAGKAVAPGTAGAMEQPTEPGSLEGFLGRVRKINSEQGKTAQRGGAR
jgi:hypothetical protein